MNDFKNKRKRTKVQRAIKLSVFACGVFALFLIFQVASVADATHKKLGKQKELSALHEKNKESEARVAGLKASQNIKQSAQDLEMVNISDVNYVKVDGGNVAINR